MSQRLLPAQSKDSDDIKGDHFFVSERQNRPLTKRWLGCGLRLHQSLQA